MDANNLDYFGEKFSQLQAAEPENIISTIRRSGFETFNETGLPTHKTEEWKYTRISNLFNKEYSVSADQFKTEVTAADVEAIRLPGSEIANELVFVNGKFASHLSSIRSPESDLVILPLNEAANGSFKELVAEHLNKSSLGKKDGIHALNTSFIYGGVFIYVNKNKVVEQPVFLYHIADGRVNRTLAQPRSLVFVDKNAKLQLVENYLTLGSMDSFTNEVIEIVADDNSTVEYYKLQNDKSTASQVSTTHIRQIGKCYVHTFVASLNGGTIRNNTDIVMEAAGNEAHMYGLYLLNGKTHVDNQTLVDNRLPHCFSNELYKGIVDGESTGVFSGRIFVRPDAQKTNAYQSNKNILLSDDASINTKPQLEIFADDVKCSHGCTIGQLDEEALFYLQARGISKDLAKAMLLQAFATDVVEQINLEPLRNYVQDLITARLALN